MPKYEFILVEHEGDASTRCGPAIRPETMDLQAIVRDEVPLAAKAADHKGARFYMVKRLLDDVDVASGPIIFRE